MRSIPLTTKLIALTYVGRPIATVQWSARDSSERAEREMWPFRVVRGGHVISDCLLYTLYARPQDGGPQHSQ